MVNPYTPESIEIVVRGILEEVLGQGGIDRDAAIVDDLGADSLDFVELNTAVEKRLGITLPKRSALEHGKRLVGGTEQFYGLRTGLTADGVYLLANSFFRYQGLKPGMSGPAIFNQTTLGNMVNLVHALFEFLPETCPDCGHGEAKVAPTGKVICGACSAVLRPMEGDEAHALHLGTLLNTPVPV